MSPTATQSKAPENAIAATQGAHDLSNAALPAAAPERPTAARPASYTLNTSDNHFTVSFRGKKIIVTKTNEDGSQPKLTCDLEEDPSQSAIDRLHQSLNKLNNSQDPPLAKEIKQLVQNFDRVTATKSIDPSNDWASLKNQVDANNYPGAGYVEASLEQFLLGRTEPTIQINLKASGNINLEASDQPSLRIHRASDGSVRMTLQRGSAPNSPKFELNLGALDAGEVRQMASKIQDAKHILTQDGTDEALFKELIAANSNNCGFRLTSVDNMPFKEQRWLNIDLNNVTFNACTFEACFMSATAQGTKFNGCNSKGSHFALKGNEVIIKGGSWDNTTEIVGTLTKSQIIEVKEFKVNAVGVTDWTGTRAQAKPGRSLNKMLEGLIINTSTANWEVDVKTVSLSNKELSQWYDTNGLSGQDLAKAFSETETSKTGKNVNTLNKKDARIASHSTGLVGIKRRVFGQAPSTGVLSESATLVYRENEKKSKQICYVVAETKGRRSRPAPKTPMQAAFDLLQVANGAEESTSLDNPPAETPGRVTSNPDDTCFSDIYH